MSRTGRAALALRVVLTAVVVSGVAFAAPGTARGGSSAPAGEGARAARCAAEGTAFRPASISIPGVVGSTRVLATGRDRSGAPRTPPLTDRGRWQLAWDRTVRPGADRGVVRLNAHTYPRSGAYGTALGNRLLARLRPGHLLVVSGPRGQRRCYRVVRQVQVDARRQVRAYYSSSVRSRVAILVCSGRRRGPGDWSHRTIWFADPVRRR